MVAAGGGVAPARWLAGLDERLGRAAGEEDTVRHDVRACLTEYLGNPGAVLVIDGFGGATHRADAAWACPGAGVAAYLGWQARQRPPPL
jgi:hypothetical protein